MTAMGDLVETWHGRLWLGLFAVLLALIVAPAHARVIDVERDLCHAVSSTALGDDALSGLRFSCRGAPAGYQQASLWLRAPIDGAAPRSERAKKVPNTPCDRLSGASANAEAATRRPRSSQRGSVRGA